MNLDELTIGDVKKLGNLIGGAKQEIVQESGDIRIVILQRGWIMVGRYERNGYECKLTNAYNVRKWGTSKGLGEIAENGPTPDTILDPVPEVSFHKLTEIATLKCEESKWKKICK